VAEEAQTSEQEIEECGLRKNFGGKEAVTGIDLEAAAVSLAGMFGPNRAGNPISLSMMTGLLRPGAGQGAGCLG
jgi:ABC-type lipopolysaccharide export system ATPase subunit